MVKVMVRVMVTLRVKANQYMHDPDRVSRVKGPEKDTSCPHTIMPEIVMLSDKHRTRGIVMRVSCNICACPCFLVPSWRGQGLVVCMGMLSVQCMALRDEIRCVKRAMWRGGFRKGGKNHSQHEDGPQCGADEAVPLAVHVEDGRVQPEYRRGGPSEGLWRLVPPWCVMVSCAALWCPIQFPTHVPVQSPAPTHVRTAVRGFC